MAGYGSDWFRFYFGWFQFRLVLVSASFGWFRLVSVSVLFDFSFGWFRFWLISVSACFGWFWTRFLLVSAGFRFWPVLVSVSVSVGFGFDRLV